MGAGTSWVHWLHFANDNPLENMVGRTTTTYYSHDLCFHRWFLCIMACPLLSLVWCIQQMAEMVWKFPEASLKGLGCGAAQVWYFSLQGLSTCSPSPRGQLGLPHSVVAGSEQIKAEAPRPFKGNSQNWHYVTSVIFRLKQITGQPRFKDSRNRLHF